MIKKIDYKTIIKSILVFLSFWYSKYLQLIPMAIFNLTSEKINNNPTILTLLSLYTSIIFSIFLFFIYKKELKEEFIKFKNNFIENIDTGFKSWFIGLLIMFISNLILFYIIRAGGAKNENILQNMIKASPIIMLFDACIIGPFNEEIVFRKTLKDIFKNKWLFFIASFIIFGGAHVITNATSIKDWLYIIPYGSLGVAFAKAYYDTDTIFTSMFFHILHNTVLTVLYIIIL